jgi:hypothetical protein
MKDTSLGELETAFRRLAAKAKAEQRIGNQPAGAQFMYEGQRWIITTQHNPTRHEVMCVNLKTGAVKWRSAFHTVANIAKKGVTP